MNELDGVVTEVTGQLSSHAPRRIETVSGSSSPVSTKVSCRLTLQGV